ncbi:uncharacterized protein UMAG_11981 [Mycosarcoma maydis]|uniref:Uncharacterized protein n=1 Tax=Mycosarcoma maydis TaxID=5270 RepID=A0A0D1DXZ5_MYCMD|nr:uncharacterized protein UMAG_11981 [Ustilago maydis 521]KIS67390.1 hypothetical protein UMAG_11981 [Ustilago maydis 521]|eukprot:XP_011391007.1 hypothetical protein UMAG_11981 [Ustilago maydis 521]
MQRSDLGACLTLRIRLRFLTFLTSTQQHRSRFAQSSFCLAYLIERLLYVHKLSPHAFAQDSSLILFTMSWTFAERACRALPSSLNPKFQNHHFTRRLLWAVLATLTPIPPRKAQSGFRVLVHPPFHPHAMFDRRCPLCPRPGARTSSRQAVLSSCCLCHCFVWNDGVSSLVLVMVIAPSLSQCPGFNAAKAVGRKSGLVSFREHERSCKSDSISRCYPSEQPLGWQGKVQSVTIVAGWARSSLWGRE